MFTGIITHIGELKEKQGSVFTFSVSRTFCNRLKSGSSIAVNGCCLTVLDRLINNSFSVEIMPETTKKTTLGKLKIGDYVNLELPVSAMQLISGHIVLGHVDGVGIIKKVKKDSNSRILTIKIRENLGKYIVAKGSIAVNGVSLTVINVLSTEFTVGIIPYTWRNTMMSKLKISDLVNIEVDILAKYTEKLLQLNSSYRQTKVVV